MVELEKSLQKLDIKHPSVGSLDAYLRYVNQIPLLSAEEEHNLATRLQKNNEIAAAKPLILSHLRYVARVSKSYMGYGLPLADLIQEGNVGLMKAVRRFNPDVGVRLVTFAMHWIKAEIHEYILRNWRIVKVATTKAQRKLFFNLRSLKKRLGWMTKQEVDEVAQDLGVKPEVVREMELRLSTTDAPFDGGSDDDDQAFTPAGFLEDHRYDPAQQFENQDWSTQSNDVIYVALNKLDERSQDIIRTRWLNEDNKITLQSLADKYAVSAERIRQLEKAAMNKLRHALQEVA